MVKSKYSAKGRAKVGAAIREQYHSRKASVKARPRKQKIAIGLSKARSAGLKVPRARRGK